MECGLAASPGIAIGKAYVYNSEISFPDGFIDIEKIELEVERFVQGVANAKKEITIQMSDIENIGGVQNKIMKAHSQIIEDPMLAKLVIENIKRDNMNAETALRHTINYLEETFLKMNTEYMQERAADIKDIGNRLLNRLLGIKEYNIALEEKCIIVAHDIMPSDLMKFDKTKILGFVTEIGGTTSHIAIIARTIGIPAVVGVKDISSVLNTGDSLIVDGDSGKVFTKPDTELIAKYALMRDEYKKLIEENKKTINVQAITNVGKRIILGANIGSADDITFALENGAEKIGLFRTEFIYMAKDQLPDEEEQYQIYKSVIENMQGKPVVIRTLDIGGDKNIPYLRIQKEDNPFLGLRGIRYCLKNKDIFKMQLRAILRASGYSELTILLPMVSNCQEVIDTKELINLLKHELEFEGHPVGTNVKIGVMIEVPSAALIVDELAELVDYFSIGTNDLCQYILAMDRTNKQLSDIYDPKHPAIIRLISTIIECAHRKGKKVSICGEMGGNVEYTQILIDAGIDEISMNALSIPKIKILINTY
jgi:phosphoenolpyruvate-protein phosphotransferase (PTS system enzyme I)